MRTKSIIKFKKITDIVKAIKTAYYHSKYKHIEYIKNEDLTDNDPFDMTPRDDYDSETITTEDAGEPVIFHVNLKQYYPYTLYRTDSGDGVFSRLTGNIPEIDNAEVA